MISSSIPTVSTQGEEGRTGSGLSMPYSSSECGKSNLLRATNPIYLNSWIFNALCNTTQQSMTVKRLIDISNTQTDSLFSVDGIAVTCH